MAGEVPFHRGAKTPGASRIDTSVPHSARIWNYWLGGKDNLVIEHARQNLSFSHPIGLMFIGVLGHIDEYDEARAIVRRLVDALPPGSHLVIADGVDRIPEALDTAQRNYDEGGSVPYRLRTAVEIIGFFDGTELLDPGLVPAPLRLPEVAPALPLPEVQPLGGIGRKP